MCLCVHLLVGMPCIGEGYLKMTTNCNFRLRQTYPSMYFGKCYVCTSCGRHTLFALGPNKVIDATKHDMHKKGSITIVFIIFFKIIRKMFEARDSSKLHPFMTH